MSVIVHRSVLREQAYRRTSAAAGPSAEPAAGQFDRCPGWSPGRCDRLSRPSDRMRLIVMFVVCFFCVLEISGTGGYAWGYSGPGTTTTRKNHFFLLI